MDLFQNLFRFLTGKTNELEKPIFKKPYVDKTYDMLELARKLDTAPEESKPIFRAAMESMAARIDAHQKVRDVLEASEFPIVILYDVHLLTPAGSAVIDYIILSNRFVATLSCPTAEGAVTPGEARAAGSPGAPRRLPDSEHGAFILTDLLREEKLVSKRELKMVWPITVLPTGTADGPSADPQAAFPTTQSRVYPDIRRAQTVRAGDLVDTLKQMFKLDEDFLWIDNRNIFVIAERLLEMDADALSCKVPPNVQKPEGSPA